MIFAYLAPVIFLAIGLTAATVARSKRRSPILWGILGFLLPVMLIVVLVLPSTEPEGALPR